MKQHDKLYLRPVVASGHRLKEIILEPPRVGRESRLPFGPPTAAICHMDAPDRRIAGSALSRSSL